MALSELTTSAALKNTAFGSTEIIPILILTLMILPLTLRIYAEYVAYLSLGPGGTPASVSGFLRVQVLGLFRLRNPYMPPAVAPDQKGYLASLPNRHGSRPEVRGIAPQRQITQKPSPEMVAAMTARIEALASMPNSAFGIGTSCFEKHGTGLFISTSKTSSTKSHTTHTCKREVCHIHGSDGSMHLTLHPADAKIVLEAGWGERHPLSRGGGFERFVPRGFVMIYAGRDEGEMEVLVSVVRAAGWFVGGGLGEEEEIAVLQ